MADWANAHGFTADRLAWIQPGYPPQTFGETWVEARTAPCRPC